MKRPIREYFRAVQAGVPINEAKKKIVGNLCVLTGPGSGGGFANCGGAGGSGGSEDTIELKKKQRAADKVASTADEAVEKFFRHVTGESPSDGNKEHLVTIHHVKAALERAFLSGSNGNDESLDHSLGLMGRNFLGMDFDKLDGKALGKKKHVFEVDLVRSIKAAFNYGVSRKDDQKIADGEVYQHPKHGKVTVTGKPDRDPRTEIDVVSSKNPAKSFSVPRSELKKKLPGPS